jgi:glycosyltransferase involved in cell wall biosynthesis
MTGECRISVVIPTYNRRGSLAATLRALTSQVLMREAFEVVVSIDGSQDGTRELLVNFRAPYKLVPIWFPNSGRATACNRGARFATGEIILFFDDDMEPDPHCLSAHLAAHQGGARKAVLGPIPFSQEASPTPLLEFLRAKTDTVLKRLAQPDYKMRVRDFYSSNLSLPRDLFFELDGFDESFRLYGNEDVEFACRLARAGIPIIFNPRATARQQYLKDFRGLSRDNMDKGRTAVLLAMKHPEVITQLRLSEYHQCSKKWRFLRALLLLLSDIVPQAPEWLIRCFRNAEAIRPATLNRLYLFSLDYYFWLGVRRGLRENREAAQLLPALIRGVGEVK